MHSHSNRTLLLLAATTAAALTLPASAIWHDFDEATAIIGRKTLPSPTSLFMPQDITLSPATGKAFVVDYGNHRVLRYSSAAALANGQAAEAAFGQPDLYSGESGLSADHLYGPQSVAVDSAGHMWVSDTENHRILRWDNADTAGSGTAAVQVLGQTSFTVRGGGTSQSLLQRPGGIALDGAGRLWVADYFNNRVLRFDNPTAKGNGGLADGVLGQPNYTSGNVGLTINTFNSPYDLDVDAQGRLWVADFGNDRVLCFFAPTAGIQEPASLVLGQADFTSKVPGGGKAQCRSAIQVEATPTGSVFVMDGQNNRVLRWDNAVAKANGANADGVLGRTGLDDNSGYSTTAGYITSECRGMHGDAAGHLWMADRGNDRVPRWDNVNGKPNGANADGAIGQVNAATTPFSSINPALSPIAPRSGLDDPISGKFFVADSGRVLRYANRSSAINGAAPEASLGKADMFDYGGASPSQVELGSTWGLALDSGGRLWVSDPDNNRVVAFANAATAATGATMSVVLGQVDFNHKDEGLSQTGMNHPHGLCIDAAGNLYVADYGNQRVLRFANIANAASGAGATAVIGQPDFVSSGGPSSNNKLLSPSGVCTDAQGRLWVADPGKSRVTRYNTPLTSAPLDAPSGILGGTGGITPGTMSQPHAVAVDPSGRLFVLDAVFNRIMRFENAAAKPDGANADGVLGEPNLNSYVLDGRTLRTSRRCNWMFLDAANHLWLGDEGNARLIRFSSRATAHIISLNLTDTNYGFTFSGEANIPYTVKSSTDLKNWQTEQTYNLSVPGTQVFSKLKNGPKRFYRVEEP